jgi:poly(hydroxyalkanoate) depolymerase family esterase
MSSMDWKGIVRIFRGAQPAPSQPVAEGRWVSGRASRPSGSRKYKLWIPAAYEPATPSPLVMMLHGCRQDPVELAVISGMNAVADLKNFLVVYPEQPMSANLLRCWNWFERKHQSRGSGEPSLLAAVIEEIRSSHNVDIARTYVVGLSAGAAMAVVLAATYPDLFAGVGAIAGLEFGAASSLREGLSAMKNGGPAPNQQGIAAFQAMNGGLSARTKSRMPLIVFQGTADPYVNPVNAEQLIMQWAKTNHCLDGDHGNNDVLAAVGELTNGSAAGGYNFQKYTYKDSAGRLLMEKWLIDGLGHAWPGSAVSGDFADPKGPNASQEMWRFFCETTEVAGEYVGIRRGLWDRLVGLFR